MALDPKQMLQLETQAAFGLLATVREVIGDDEEAAHDAIEGETSLFEAVDAALDEMARVEALAEGARQRMSAIRMRADRFDAKAEKLRAAISSTMWALDLKRIERPDCLIVQPKLRDVLRLVDESEIPVTFQTEVPASFKLDRKALTEALKTLAVKNAEGERAALAAGGEFTPATIPGAELVKSDPTITIRTT